MNKSQKTRPRRAHFRLLSALLLCCTGSALAGELEAVNTFSPENTTINSPTTYTVDISYASGPALTNLNFSNTIKGLASVSSYTTTCGGSLSIGGTSDNHTLTLTDAGISAAQAGTPTHCTITVHGTTLGASGSYTTSIEVGTLTADRVMNGTPQTLVNQTRSTKSLTLLALQPLTSVMSSSQALPSWAYPTGGVQGTGNKVIWGQENTIKYTVTNPNGVDVTNADFNFVSGYLKYDTTKPFTVTSTCTPSSGVGGAGALSASNAAQVNITGATIPANGTCTYTVVGTMEGRDLANTSNGAVLVNGTYIAKSVYNENAASVGSDSQVLFRVTNNTTSTNLNTSALLNSYSYYDNLRLMTGWNGSPSATISAGVPTDVTMNLRLDNFSTQTDTLSTQSEALPTWLDFSTATITARSLGGTGTCDASGVSLDPVTRKVIINNKSLAADTSCVIDIKFPQTVAPAGDTAVAQLVRQGRTLDPAIGSSWNVGNYDYYAAFLQAKTPGSMSKEGSSNLYLHNYQWYRINLDNTLGTADLTGVTFTDSLAGNPASYPNDLNILPQYSYTTCAAGTLTYPDSRTITFSGGTVTKGTSCKVVIATSQPADTAARYNKTPTVTSTQGVLTPPTTGSYVPLSARQPYMTLAVDPSPIAVGETAIMKDFVYYGAHQATPYNGTITLPTGIKFPANAQLTVTCQVDGVTQTSPVSITSQSDQQLSYTLNMVNNNPLLSSNNIDTQSLNDFCTLSYAVQGTVANATPYAVTPSLQQPTDNYTMSATNHVQVVDTNKYQLSKVFNPATVSVGLASTLTVGVTKQSGTLSGETYRVTDHLPDGIEVSKTTYPPNQTDGSYIDAGGCFEVLPSYTTVVFKCASTSMQVIATKYGQGNNINTINPTDFVGSRGGTVTQPVSATLLAQASVPIQKSFSPTTIGAYDQSTLSIRVFNAAPATSPNNVIAFSDVLPTGLISASPALSGTCAGAALTVTGGSQLSFSGITLGPDQECTLQVQVKASDPTAITSQQVLTNTIGAGMVDSTAASTNPLATSATLTINPASKPTFTTPPLVKEQAICAGGDCSAASWSQSPAQAYPCNVIGYRITLSNPNAQTLNKVSIHDPWPSNLIFLKAALGGTQAGGTPTFQLGSSTPSTSLNSAAAGQVITAWLDQSGNLTNDNEDVLDPAKTLVLLMAGQVSGQCPAVNVKF